MSHAFAASEAMFAILSACRPMGLQSAGATSAALDMQQTIQATRLGDETAFTYLVAGIPSDCRPRSPTYTSHRRGCS